MKSFILSVAALAILLLPSRVSGQTNYKFDKGIITEVYNDPQNLPKNEFAFSFISVGNLFGCRIYENYRLDETQNVWARVTLPYGKGSQGGDVTYSLEDKVKIGYNIRLGYERALLGGEVSKFKTTFLKSQGNEITFTKDIPTIIRRQLITSGGLELNRLGNQITYYPAGFPDDPSLLFFGLNPSFTAIFIGVGVRSDYSLALFSDDYDGGVFKQSKMRSFRASVDLVVALSQKLNNYLIEVNTDRPNSVTPALAIDADDERLIELSQKNIGFRISLDRTASQFGWKSLIVVYGFDYTMIPSLDGGPKEMVNLHAGVGFMSKKNTRKSLYE